MAPSPGPPATSPSRSPSYLPAPIHPLPGSLSSFIRSAVSIPSLPRVVLELVQNALDADARDVRVRADLARWALEVLDDGVGITSGEYGMAGLGARYFSSKATTLSSLDNVSTFGFCGETLASLSNLALVEITSRPRTDGAGRNGEPLTAIFRDGKRFYCGPSRTAEARLLGSSGTSVSLRDLFHKLPVRRRSHSPIAGLESIRRELERTALLFPHVSFSLWDVSRDGLIFGPEGGGAHASGEGGRRKVWSVRKTYSLLERFRQIFGNALAEEVEEIRSTEGDLVLEGFISLCASPSRQQQFIYVNERSLERCDLHELVSDLFARSSFPIQINEACRAMEHDSPSGTKVRKSPSRPKAPSHPVYVLNLRIPASEVDVLFDPAKSVVAFKDWPSVSALFAEAITRTLQKLGLWPARSDHLANDDRSRSSPSRSPSPHAAKLTRRPVSSEGRLASLSEGSLKRKRCTDPAELAAVRELEGVASSSDGFLRWTDPSSSQAFLIDRRTGNSYAADHPRFKSIPASLPRAESRSIMDKGFPTGGEIAVSRQLRPPGHGVLRRRSGDDKGQPVPWLEEILQGWTNPVFPSPEIPIPTLDPPAAVALEPSSGRPCSSHRPAPFSGTFSRFFDQAQSSDEHGLPHPPSGDSKSSRSSPQTFGRESLKGAQVIAQVDRKFLLCKARGRAVRREEEGDEEEDEEMMVLIDQHAADERIRLERFFRSFTADVQSGALPLFTFPSEEPARMLVSRREARLLSSDPSKHAAFRTWGLGVEVDVASMEVAEAADSAEDEVGGRQGRKEGAAVQLLVRHVPLIVSDRLVADEEALRETMTGYLAWLEEHSAGTLSGAVASQMTSGKETDWVSALRGAPRRLLDLIVSKACRGAIMFNDRLELEQCERLVDQLSETVFPFQCAHGRPSLIPVLSLSSARKRRRGRPINWAGLRALREGGTAAVGGEGEARGGQQ